jgi:glucose/arabinose dehydrogenase
MRRGRLRVGTRRRGANRALHAALVAAVLCGGLGAAAGAAAARLEPVTVARGLDHPWALAFLPDGRMLVTERRGLMRIVARDGQVSAPLAGLPAVAAEGECGLLDVALDPDHERNGLVYWTYAEPGDGGSATTLARGRLRGLRLEAVEVLFRQSPKVASRFHCGSRIAFGPDGALYLGLGDRGQQDAAQQLDNGLGKLVRIERDGRVPGDNPYAGRPGAVAAIWTLGHRNVQGLAFRPGTDELWALEHGPQGGDELNLIRRGANYGWPLVTRGRQYGSGARIGEEGPKPGFEPPVRDWVPVSIAPSGLTFLTSERYPGWRGSLFFGTLRAQALVRLELAGDRVVAEERLLTGLTERIRDVRQGPDGWLYLLTDNADGRVIRLER